MVSDRTFHSVFVLSVLLVPFVLFAPTGAALAQQPDIRPYETEEDLWEALSESEITFDEFLELLDLVRSGGDSLITPPSDWEALPGSDAGYLVLPDSSQTITRSEKSVAERELDLPYVTSFRSGVDADLSQPVGSDGYSILRWQRDSFRGLLDWEHDRDDGGIWRRRSLIWQPRKLTFVLGNFEPRWGRGLVVGRRSRVIRPSDREGDFAHPILSRYDGLYFATNPNRLISTEFFGSAISAERLRENVAGMLLRGRAGDWTIGAAVSGYNVYRPDTALYGYGFGDSVYHESDFGVHLGYDGKRADVIGEFAVNGEGASAKAIELVWPLTHGRFHARAWSYGNGYLNPLNGGPANGDTQPVLIDTLDYTFSSRTAGERGFDFTTRLALTSSVRLRWDWMSHREEPGANLEHSGVVRAEIKRPMMRLTPFVRGRIDEDNTESFSIGNYAWLGPKHRELNLRCELGRHNKGETQFIRAGVGFNLQIHHTVLLTPAIRWVDPNLDAPGDGYWYLYFTERLIPVSGARCEMVLVWKKYEESSREDPVELRARLYLR